LYPADEGRFFTIAMIHSGSRPGTLASGGKREHSAQCTHTLQKT
jgi:hypothetical protein